MLLIAELAENKFRKHMAELKLFQSTSGRGNDDILVLLNSAGN